MRCMPGPLAVGCSPDCPLSKGSIEIWSNGTWGGGGPSRGGGGAFMVTVVGAAQLVMMQMIPTSRGYSKGSFCGGGYRKVSGKVGSGSGGCGKIGGCGFRRRWQL